MKDRNKLLLQILDFAEYYGLEIININFTNINELKDEIEFTFKIEHNKFTIKYSYKKHNMYAVNSVECFIKYKLSEILKEE